MPKTFHVVFLPISCIGYFLYLCKLARRSSPSSCTGSTSILMLGSRPSPSPPTWQLSESSQRTVTLARKNAWKKCYVIVWSVASTTKASNASYCLKVTAHTRALWHTLSPLIQQRTMPRIKVGSAPLQPVQYTQKGVKFASSHTSPTCYHCGGLHLAPASPHKEKVCRYCKTKGHLDRVCCAKAHALAKSDPPATGPSSDKKPPKRTHYIQEQPEQEDNSGGNEYSLNAIHDEPCPQFTITLHINNTPLEMEVNTGARESSGESSNTTTFFLAPICGRKACRLCLLLIRGDC